MKAVTSASEFLAVAHEFKLGRLPTESQHPKSLKLSELALNDLGAAFDLFKEIDGDALAIFNNPSKELLEWFEFAIEHLKSGGRIFLGGCGATGRLSLGLEFLCSRLSERGEFPYKPSQVISLMAGGDVALIASIEKFEDFPEYGARQLEELGFNENDLFVGITEGGETPWVIGATNWASQISKHRPYFFYCNPDDVLCDLATRSKEVIENNKIKKVNLTCGPMALSGSTRLQSSTVLMIGVGMGLCFSSAEDRKRWWSEFESAFKELSYAKMAKLCEDEAAIYERGEFSIYRCNEDYGLTVLTDTTERSPTFSLTSFENRLDEKPLASWTYLSMDVDSHERAAWMRLLGRAPRTLEWDETIERTGMTRLLGFPVGDDALSYRKALTEEGLSSKLHSFEILSSKANGNVTFKLGRISQTINLGESLFTQIMLLKMLLNAHSTLIMGRLGRFESNIMTYVRPSNNKLIDRMTRYTLALLKMRGMSATYEQVVEAYFANRTELLGSRLGAERPVVIELVNRLMKTNPTKAKDTSL